MSKSWAPACICICRYYSSGSHECYYLVLASINENPTTAATFLLPWMQVCGSVGDSCSHAMVKASQAHKLAKLATLPQITFLCKKEILIHFIWTCYVVSTVFFSKEFFDCVCWLHETLLTFKKQFDNVTDLALVYPYPYAHIYTCKMYIDSLFFVRVQVSL